MLGVMQIGRIGFLFSGLIRYFMIYTSSEPMGKTRGKGSVGGAELVFIKRRRFLQTIICTGDPVSSTIDPVTHSNCLPFLASFTVCHHMAIRTILRVYEKNKQQGKAASVLP